MKSLFGAIFVCLLLLCQEAIVTQTQAAAAAGGAGGGNGSEAANGVQGSSTQSTVSTSSGSSTQSTVSTSSGSSTQSTVSTSSGSSTETTPPSPIKVTLEGLVYDDCEPEEWEDELRDKSSEEWKELNKELCETVIEALETQSKLKKALTSCDLMAVKKVRVQNFHDGDDDDDDDKDDTDDDKDDDKNNNGSSDDNNGDDGDDDDDETSNTKNKLRKSAGQNGKVRPNIGEWMDGVQAQVDLMFNKNVDPSLDYSVQNIEKIIATQGAQNKTSSFGRNIGKDHPDGATRHGSFTWIVGVLTLATLLY